MSRPDRRLARYINALIENRRPRKSPAGEDSAAMQVAARLRGAHTGGADPSPAFVDQLARQLRDASDREPGWADAGIRRRRFLAGGLATVAASVAAGVGVERLHEVLTQPQSGGGTIEPYISAWVAVAKLPEVIPGKIKQFSAGGVQGVVFTLDGEVRALSAVCTHQGCTLIPEAGQGKLVCPCHPMSFNLTGAANPGDYRLNPLPTIKTRVNADSVEVLVPAWQ